MTQVMTRPTLFLAPGNARTLARGADATERRLFRPPSLDRESSPAPSFPARAEPPGARARIVLRPKAVKRTRAARIPAANGLPQTNGPSPLATIRQYLESAFLGRGVCLLTHSGRICGALASFDGGDCLVRGEFGERRIPLREVLGVAHQPAETS